MGVTGHDAEMTDFSPDGYAALAELRRETLPTPNLPPRALRPRPCGKDASREHLELRLEQFDAGEYLRTSSTLGSPASSVRRTFDLMAPATEADWPSSRSGWSSFRPRSQASSHAGGRSTPGRGGRSAPGDGGGAPGSRLRRRRRRVAFVLRRPASSARRHQSPAFALSRKCCHFRGGRL